MPEVTITSQSHIFDAGLLSSQQNTSYNLATSIALGTYMITARAVGRINLQSYIPQNAIIDNAIFTVKLAGALASNGSMTLNQLRRDDVVFSANDNSPSYPTYNNWKSGSTNWSGCGNSATDYYDNYAVTESRPGGTPTGTPINFDVTEQIRLAISQHNKVWNFRMSGGAGQGPFPIHSMNAVDVNNRPSLYIQYSLPANNDKFFMFI